MKKLIYSIVVILVLACGEDNQDNRSLDIFTEEETPFEEEERIVSTRILKELKFIIVSYYRNTIDRARFAVMVVIAAIGVFTAAASISRLMLLWLLVQVAARRQADQG